MITKRKHTDMVRSILEQFPITRDNDTALYCILGRRFMGLSVEEQELLFNTMLKVGNYESIRRARQLVQAEYPELGPTKSRAKGRNEAEQKARITKGKSVANDSFADRYDNNFIS